MTETPESRPWEELESLVSQADAVGVDAFLDELSIGEAARAVARLGEDDQSKLLTTLSTTDAAELIEHLPHAQAAELLDHLDPADAAAIVHELPSDEQVDVLQEMDRAGADAILAELEPAEARDVRQRSAYDRDVAGGLMITEFLSVPTSTTVTELTQQLRRERDRVARYAVLYLYVTDARGRLAGVLPMRELLLADEKARVGDVMIAEPISTTADTPLLELAQLFERHTFFGIPVVDETHHLLGVVRRADAADAERERAESDLLKAQGIVGGEELRTMPVTRRAARRLSWLSVNILLNVFAASVIAMYQETLASVIALAVFLPIISDMSGCSGNQAVAVSMRELSLGLIKPGELIWVWLKEMSVGVINGLVLGGLIATVAFLWKGNAALGLVVGAALAINTVIAVSIGGTMPLLLRRLGFDPALASGPILTTVTDMCGFFLVLSSATVLIEHLI